MATIEELEARIAQLENYVGKTFLEGPQLSQMPPAQFATLLVPANELPNGEYNFALWQALTNRIIADQASVIATQGVDIQILKLAVIGSVTPTPDAGDIPGFGNGFHLKSGTFEALIFISDFDNALRILTNHKANNDGGFTHANKKLGQQRIDIETFGVGVSYWTPLENDDGTPFVRTALDNQGGKGLVIVNHSPDNHRAPYVKLYAGLPGQGLQIGVSPNTANVMENPTIQIEADGTKSIG